MEIEAKTETERRVAKVLGDGKSYELPEGMCITIEVCEIGGPDCPRSGGIAMVFYTGQNPQKTLNFW